MTLSRRDFMGTAVALGASLAWGGRARASRVRWRERRDLYLEGVASGDPDPHSVILWTRRPFEDGQRNLLTVEVAEDEAFRRVVTQARAPVAAAADWTTRVLVGGLKPARTYWYRFTDADGNGSRIGRTITAPLDSDPRAVNFAFVSCQDVNEGKLNAYRRMIFEDERAAPENQLGFVLHLGDFIYEVVEYPEEVKTRYDRTIYEVARIPDSGKTGKFHYPTYATMSTGDYGTDYRERAEIYDLVRDEGITGFAIVSGDRHSFWAGYAASELPPGKFEPAGLSFVGASLSSAGTMEAYEHSFHKDHPLRPLFLVDRPGAARPDWAYNMLLKHGVRSCLEYARSFDLKLARSLSNPSLAPHLEFVDLGSHGYATVRLTGDEMRTEFVCIPRPIARSERPDGGPLRYRVVHSARLWAAGERPKLAQQVLEGDVGLSI
jgi:hypothetical protein